MVSYCCESADDAPLDLHTRNNDLGLVWEFGDPCVGSLQLFKGTIISKVAGMEEDIPRRNILGTVVVVGVRYADYLFVHYRQDL
jgi:hypothetical protein